MADHKTFRALTEGQIEAAARQFLTNLGLDPDDEITTNYAGSMTDAEFKADKFTKGGSVMPAMALKMPAWRAQRGAVVRYHALKHALSMLEATDDD